MFKKSETFIFYKMFICRLLNLIILLTLCCVEGKVSSSIENAYKKGVSAYTGERWTECITQFEESLHLYKLYKSVAVNCKLKCNSKSYISHVNENIEDLKIYEKFLNVRNCLIKCMEKGFDDVRVSSDVPESTILDIKSRKPYEYLHLCYFQIYGLQKAASAAYTYLVTNPEDETMKNNLKYYSDQPEVDINEVIDLESEDYSILYNLGINSYKKNNWAETVASMEEVLTDYLSSENVCRAECERQPEQESASEFVLTMSNNIASLLHCRQLCQEKLKSMKYSSGIEFLAEVLNYLQISYYNLDRFEDAAKAVATYLALMPNDSDMLENKKMYATLTDEKSFTKRSDIIYYMNRDSYEKRLLQLFHNEDNDFNTESNAI